MPTRKQAFQQFRLRFMEGDFIMAKGSVRKKRKEMVLPFLCGE